MKRIRLSLLYICILQLLFALPTRADDTPTADGQLDGRRTIGTTAIRMKINPR